MQPPFCRASTELQGKKRSTFDGMLLPFFYPTHLQPDLPVHELSDGAEVVAHAESVDVVD